MQQPFLVGEDLAGCGKLIKMLITVKSRGIFDDLYIIFLIGRENDKEKKKKYKDKNIGHAWIRSTVSQAVG